MFCIGICDDDEGLCGELEKMLYDYGKEHKIQMKFGGMGWNRFIYSVLRFPYLLLFTFCLDAE